MSCFVVSPLHIDILVSWAMAHKAPCFPAPLTPLMVANLLADANNQAYAERYKEPVTSHYRFEFRETAGKVPALQILKACRCLKYQCSDWSEWKESRAFQLVDAIESMAIHKLPSYDDMLWELTPYLRNSIPA
jgi:hypothetical protein